MADPQTPRPDVTNDLGQDAQLGEMTPERWAAREIRKAPELTERQIRNLCRLYGFAYKGP